MDDPLTYGIKTDAGRELVIYMNKHYGSAIWGRVQESVKAIELELINMAKLDRN